MSEAPNLSEAMNPGAESEARAGSDRGTVQSPFGFGRIQGAALTKRDYLFAGLVFAFAIVLRLIYLLQISKSPIFDSPILDAEAHLQWAQAILEGSSPFAGSAYFKAPLYPYFLAAITFITRDEFWAPRIVQIVMGSASCSFVYLLGREAFNRTVGLIAGLLAAANWVMIYFDAELLLEPLFIFLLLISLWLLLRAAKHDSAWRWGVAGLFMGLATIDRPNTLAFIPLVGLWIVWIERQHLGTGVARAGLWLAACFLPILPVTARNYLAGNDLVLIASQAGPNFFIGNNPTADGFSAKLPGSRSTWIGGFQDWTSMAEQETGRKLKASEVDHFFFDKTWRFMRDDPSKASYLMVFKTLLYLNAWEIPNDSDLYSVTARFAPLFRKMAVGSKLVLVLGFVGVLLSLRDSKRLFPVVGYVVVFSATVIAFFVCGRFRLPVVPVLAIFAGVTLYRIGQRLREADWRALVGYAILGLVVSRLVTLHLPGRRDSYFAAVTHQHIGQKLGEKGLPGEEAEYRQALALEPGCYEAESGLGFYYARNENNDLAIEHFQKALSLNGELELHADLARLLVGRGRWEEAMATVRQGLSQLPGYLDLKRKLAFMLATCPVDHLRDGREAVELAESVAAVGEESPETYDTLAVSYAEVGRFEDAVRSDEKAKDIANRARNGDAVVEIQRRIELFRQHKPFRQSSSPVMNASPVAKPRSTP